MNRRSLLAGAIGLSVAPAAPTVKASLGQLAVHTLKKKPYLKPTLLEIHITCGRDPAEIAELVDRAMRAMAEARARGAKKIEVHVGDGITVEAFA